MTLTVSPDSAEILDAHAASAGFRRLKVAGVYDQTLAPLYARRTEREYTVALRVEARHCNFQGILHGGALATFVDMSLGKAVGAVTGPVPSVTSSLSIDYLGTAAPGDWVETTGRVLRVGKRLIVADCLVHKGGDKGEPVLMARANATFAPVKRRN